MQALLELLFASTWWKYDPADRSLFSISYRTFNLIEGTVWIGFGILVLRRYLRFRRSRLELWYAAVFALFGLTDFREAYAMQTNYSAFATSSTNSCPAFASACPI